MALSSISFLFSRTLISDLSFKLVQGGITIVPIECIRLGDYMLICHLEKLIKNSGLKKNFIASKLNISVRQLRKYETMESIAPVDKAYMLTKILNCNFEDLYEWEE